MSPEYDFSSASFPRQPWCWLVWRSFEICRTGALRHVDTASPAWGQRGASWPAPDPVCFWSRGSRLWATTALSRSPVQPEKSREMGANGDAGGQQRFSQSVSSWGQNWEFLPTLVGGASPTILPTEHLVGLHFPRVCKISVTRWLA